MKTLFTFLILIFYINNACSQSKIIKGKVSDNISTLPGVFVNIKNKTSGVTTNTDGFYKIKANEGDILVFSYLGFITTEITIGKKNIINVTLKEDENVISCYVVARKLNLKYNYTNNYFKNGLSTELNWYSNFDLHLTYKGFNKNNYLFTSKFTLKDKFFLKRYFNFGLDYSNIKINQLNFSFNSFSFFVESLFDLGLRYSTKFIINLGNYNVNTKNNFGIGFGIKQYIIPKLYIYTLNNYWNNLTENQFEIGYNFNRLYTSISYHKIMNYNTYSYNLGYSIYF